MINTSDLKQKSVEDNINKNQSVFILGSKGIPAKYGGFETFVEKLTENRKTPNVQYFVACLSDNDSQFMYNDATCFNIKVPNIGSARAVIYDLLALNRFINYCEKNKQIKKPIFYILACRIGPFINYYKKKIEKLGGQLYVNPDGHEWKRGKWSVIVRKYWKASEKLMVKHSDLLICDSKNIESYIINEYKKYKPNTIFIAYGSDTEKSSIKDEDDKIIQWYKSKSIIPKQYYLIVGRFVPENNFETMISEFMKSHTEKDLVVITTANKSFLEQLNKKMDFSLDRRVKFVGTVYDSELLKKIREDAYCYIHGHEVGGTNPSLLEALASTNINLLLEVGFNREVAENSAYYWSKEPGELSKVIDIADRMCSETAVDLGELAKKRINDCYSWEYIVSEYENLFLKYIR